MKQSNVPYNSLETYLKLTLKTSWHHGHIRENDEEFLHIRVILKVMIVALHLVLFLKKLIFFSNLYIFGMIMHG